MVVSDYILLRSTMFPNCFAFCQIYSCPSRIRQTLKQPICSQQILVADHHGHPVPIYYAEKVLCPCLVWPGTLRFVRVGLPDELAVLAGAVKVVEGLGDPVAHSGHGRPVPPGQGRRAAAAAARSAVLGARPHPEVWGKSWVNMLISYRKKTSLLCTYGSALCRAWCIFWLLTYCDGLPDPRFQMPFNISTFKWFPSYRILWLILN